jgi:DNA-binding beta-propeller fold protein YncE/predicted Ser/Thr protein kinase
VLTTGSILGDFRIEGELGRGGMGVVYRATQVSLGRPVALKVIASGLADEEGFRERFVRESRLAASLDHPNVIPVYAAGEHDGVLYIAMRYVEGTDLRALIRRESRLDPLRAAGVTAQVASALDAAHERGLVHRDVKPANVLVAARGGGEHVYLTDFGLTKRSASETSLTGAGEWVGTLDYVAPEQVRGDAVDARADIYALGCVLYELLTGRVPFPRENDLAKLWAHMSDDAPSALELAPDVPPGLAAVAQRAMAKDPADRFSEAGMMGRVALASVPGGADTGARARAAAAAALAGAPAAPAGGPTQAAPTRRARLSRLAGALGRGKPAAGGPALAPTAVADGPAARPRPARRAALLAAVALLAGCATSALLLLLLEDDDPVARTAAADRPARSSAAGAVTGTFAVGDSPTGVTALDGSVWVANTGDETVSRLDARTGRRQAPPIPVGEDPRAISASAGAVWVGNFGDATLSRIDTRTNRVAPPIPLGAAPTDIAIAAGRVWVATEGDRVHVLDAATGRPLRSPVRVKANGSLAIGGGRLWVSDRNDGTIRSVDTQTGEVIDAPIAIGESPADIAAGPRFVWVTLADDGAVRRTDLRADRAGSRNVRLGGRPERLARAGSIWVTDADREAVIRLDVATGEQVGKALAVGEDPAGLALDGGVVWVTGAADDTVTRIEAR